MKKRSKKRHIRFKATDSHYIPKQQTIEMEPEEIVPYIHQAEQQVLPLLEENLLPPAVTVFLLAQYTQVLITNDTRITTESATSIVSSVLTLWQEGLYIPSSEYPFTLEETLTDVRADLKAKQDYAGYFRPFVSLVGDTAQNLGHVSGGIVKHPETQLWQIWMIIEGPCVQLAAFRDPEKAQQELHRLITASRKGGVENDIKRIYNQISSSGDGSPKQIPFDMMQYLLEHIDQYNILL